MQEEDYLKTIHVIGDARDGVEIREIMERFGENPRSVVEALHLLVGKGLVRFFGCEVISLTPEGLAIARDLEYRHEALRDVFIDVLGGDAGTAEESACRMEHGAPQAIINRMAQYMRYL
jgi:DtxR family Mn-dependent transcriptional regulator